MNLIFKKENDSVYGVHIKDDFPKFAELYMEVDGYFVFLPLRKGFISAWMLHEIAKKLDELNKDWDNQVDIFFKNGKTDSKK